MFGFILKNKIKKKIPKKILFFFLKVKRLFLSNYFILRGFLIITSYSQQLEDIYIFNELSLPKRFLKDMYLVEVGALDGIRYSNTFMLENKFQLKSILIEPDPNNFKKILKNRPKSTCLNYAISQEEEFVKFICGDAVGGISSKMSKEHKLSFSSYFVKEIEILALPLSKVLKANAVKEIYLLSIDCEGGDLDVLKSIKFEEFFIHIILVEISHNKNEIEELITANDFYLHKNLFGNQIWVNRDSILNTKVVHPSIPIAWKTLFLQSGLKKKSEEICSEFKQTNILY